MRKNLSSLLEVMSMQVVGDMGTGISLDGEAFRTDKLTLSDKSKEELLAQMELLLAE